MLINKQDSVGAVFIPAGSAPTAAARTMECHHILDALGKPHGPRVQTSSHLHGPYNVSNMPSCQVFAISAWEHLPPIQGL